MTVLGFDRGTIALLRSVPDDAWNSLPSEVQATTRKSEVAQRILKSVAKGERDRERLRAAAMKDLAA
jgi:hypothetical protein